MTSALLEYALGYLDRGWSVVPIQPRGKKPLVAWQEYTTRKPKISEIKYWWSRWPDANIAIVTGKISDIVVVDVDTNRGGTPHALFDASPTGLISKTGSGGYHLFYKYPAQTNHVPNRVGQDGVDIRGDGGYVVGPPSAHTSGKLYKFIQRGNLGKAPGWILDTPTRGENNHNKWLSDILSGCSEGNRNDSCAKISGYFAKKGMAKDVAFQLLKLWNSNNDPRLSDKELHTTLNSIYKTSFRHIQTVHESNLGEFPVLSIKDYMTKYGGSTVRWDVDEWLPEKTIAFVVSPPGTYKTWMTLDLAVSVASGDKFLGQFEVKNPGPVLIVQQEDFHGQIAERIGIIHHSKFKPHFSGNGEEFESFVPKDIPVFLHPDRKLRFDDENIINSFTQQIKSLNPKLVIIDPLYSAGNTDNYMTKTAEQMFVLKRIRDEIGCGFLVVHHTKKNTETSSRERLWGSQFLNAFLETGWQIKPGSKTGSVIVRRHFKTRGDMDDLELEFDINTESPYKYKVYSKQGDFTEETDAIINQITKVLQDSSMTISELSTKCGVHRSTMSRKLKYMEKEGLVRKEGNKLILSDLPDF